MLLLLLFAVFKCSNPHQARGRPSSAAETQRPLTLTMMIIIVIISMCIGIIIIIIIIGSSSSSSSRVDYQ